MTFNISQFSGQIAKHGVAKSNLFVATISLPSKLQAGLESTLGTRDLRFLCRTASVPGINIATQDYVHNHIGTSEQRALGIDSYDPATLVFMMDSNFRVLQFFHQWTQGVVNFDTQSGESSVFPNTERYAHQVAYKEDYVGSIEIKMFSENNSTKSYTYQLRNAYPTSIGNIDVAWENSAEVMTLPVTFSFDRLAVSGATKGSLSSFLTNENLNVIGSRTVAEHQNIINTLDPNKGK